MNERADVIIVIFQAERVFTRHSVAGRGAGRGEGSRDPLGRPAGRAPPPPRALSMTRPAGNGC